MNQAKLIIALAAALCAVAGCKNDDGSQQTSNAPLPAPPKFISEKKAANGGGAAQFVGGAEPGSGWKTGPPAVGGKLNGGG
jgi:hypothetical protein